MLNCVEIKGTDNKHIFIINKKLEHAQSCHNIYSKFVRMLSKNYTLIRKIKKRL